MSGKTKRLSILALLLTLLFSQPLKAQDYDFSDNELKNFAKLLVEVITIQQQTQREMIAIIQENGLTIGRFNQLLIQLQEKGEEGLEATEEEKKGFLVVADAIQGIQEQMMENLTKAVVAKGMTLERYESILLAYQTDSQLQEKVHALAE